MPGMGGQAADAVKAYTQVPLKKAHELLGLPPEQCPETWISLPRSRQPASWTQIVNPVCPLERNLYGHPLVGLLWERHLEDALFKVKWRKLPGWECLYIHHDQQLFLSVYVDDFKMVGKKENLLKMWETMRKYVDLEPETELSDNVYLGCNQSRASPDQSLLLEKNQLFKKLTTHEKVLAEGDLYGPNTETTSEAAGDRGSKRKKASKNPTTATDHRTIKPYPPSCLAKTKAWNYDMIGHAEQCVQRWCELAKKETKDLPFVGTPCIDDHDLRPEDLITQGALVDVCSRIVLKCLYLARIGRPDLLYSVNILARSVTKWNRACDKRLERLIAYIHKTKSYIQHCFVGDNANECKIGLFCDASFAGDLSDSKSTTGALLCVFGPSTFVPITWVCKKHGAVSHSSSEAEVIALDAALRLEGLPAIMLWDVILECLHRAGGGPKAEWHSEAASL